MFILSLSMLYNIIYQVTREKTKRETMFILPPSILYYLSGHWSFIAHFVNFFSYSVLETFEKSLYLDFEA